MVLTDLLNNLRATAAEVIGGVERAPKLCGVVRPCPCGDPHCKACEAVEYLGNGRWNLPDHYCVSPTALSHGTQWRMYDSQGREHLLWVREA